MRCSTLSLDDERREARGLWLIEVTSKHKMGEGEGEGEGGGIHGPIEALSIGEMGES